MKTKLILALIILNLTSTTSAQDQDPLITAAKELATKIAHKVGETVKEGAAVTSDAAQKAVTTVSAGITELINPGTYQALTARIAELEAIRIELTEKLATLELTKAVSDTQIAALESAKTELTAQLKEVTAQLNAPSKLQTLVAATRARLSSMQSSAFVKNHKSAIVLGTAAIVTAGIVYVLYKRKQARENN